MNSTADVLAAATQLVEHFGNSRVDEYFDCFAPEADFIFYTHPVRLPSRAAYEDLWKIWVAEMDFKVLGCSSSNQSIKFLDSANAIFTHDVSTQIQTNQGSETLLERETIVFSLINKSWVAVHEHLSPHTN
jgi:hypothetical protein